MRCTFLLGELDLKASFVHKNFSSLFCTGVLLDDLLVAEDLAAAETTPAASHAAAAAAAILVHNQEQI